jgi:hypothetical protein
VRGKETPNDIIRRDPDCRVEIWIKWDLAGHVEWRAVPGMLRPNQSVEPDSRACTAVLTALIDHSRGVALTIA